MVEWIYGRLLIDDHIDAATLDLRNAIKEAKKL